MKTHPTSIPGLILIEPKVFKDDRGFFQERYRIDRFSELGIHEPLVQDNHSRSAPRVLRGLHFQTNPNQGKLVGVVRGRIYDVAVDLRKGSPTFGQYYAVELSDENGLQLWVPFGFAHGFCVLGDEPADVIYKVTGYYNPKTDNGFLWSDPDVGVKWPIANPILSPKDMVLPRMKELPALQA